MSIQRAAFEKQMTPIQGKAVWTRKDVEDDTSWKFQLSDAERADIHEHLMRVDVENIVLQDMNVEDFHSPGLAEKLAAMKESRVKCGGEVLDTEWGVEGKVK